MVSDTERNFWAKTFPAEGEYRKSASRTHPLWAHLIDVANVADLLWDAYLPQPLKSALIRDIGREQAEARTWYSIWVGLHDIGKATPFFQSLHEPSWAKLQSSGLTASVVSDERLHHAHATIAILFQWIEGQVTSEADAEFWKRLSVFLGFHHGRLTSKFRFEDFQWLRWAGSRMALGGEEWKHARHRLVCEVIEAWTGGQLFPVENNGAEPWPPWLLGFAGWVTLSDWIGSMSEYFPKGVVPTDDIGTYRGISREGAKKAIEEIGIADRTAIVSTEFSELFDFEEPRRLQAIATELPVGDEPSLTIFEGPTGEGKSEGAFVLEARLEKHQQNGGGYIAMPSQATSNGILPRYEKFLSRACDQAHRPNLVLVHGTADLHPSQQRLLGNEPEVQNVSDYEETPEDRADVRSREWFLPKKRALLARYGVGTVDQTFLGVLYSRHFFLRLLGLSGKTVIFDEVHAYDTYMSRLFEHLLSWLRALGTNVILLSATLPERTRERFFEAWGAESPKIEGRAHYPVVWHTAGDQVKPREIDHDEVDQDQEIQIRRHDPTPKAIADTVQEAIKPDQEGRGASVAIIVNTVTRAQKIFSALQEHMSIDLPEDDLQLLHARFTQGKRAERENKALGRFGPEREPGRPGVLVATQVAEQSLDLDFDLMLSDLAPIDLLLQRAGRLHRHQKRHGGKRPHDHQLPKLHVMYPSSKEGELPILEKHGLGFVYDKYTLFRTWHTLQKQEGEIGATWSLPEHYRSLIESVYSEEGGVPLSLSESGWDEWRSARNESERSTVSEEGEAKQRRIPSTDSLQSLVEFARVTLADDDESEVHRDLRALTRLSDVPSVEVICLHRKPGREKLYLDRDCKVEAPLDALPSKGATRAIMAQSVRITHRSLSPFLMKRSDPEWEQHIETSPALSRRKRIVFENGQWISQEDGVPDLTLDRTLGVVIHRFGAAP